MCTVMEKLSAIGFPEDTPLLASGKKTFSLPIEKGELAKGVSGSRTPALCLLDWFGG